MLDHRQLEARPAVLPLRCSTFACLDSAQLTTFKATQDRGTDRRSEPGIPTSLDAAVYHTLTAPRAPRIIERKTCLLNAHAIPLRQRGQSSAGVRKARTDRQAANVALPPADSRMDDAQARHRGPPPETASSSRYPPPGQPAGEHWQHEDERSDRCGTI